MPKDISMCRAAYVENDKLEEDNNVEAVVHVNDVGEEDDMTPQSGVTGGNEYTSDDASVRWQGISHAMIDVILCEETKKQLALNS